MLGANIYIGAFVVAVATALGIGAITQRGRVSSDTAIGVLFSGTFALGILIISRVDRYTTDLFGYLFGDVLSITTGDLWTIAILGTAVLALVAVFYRQLLFVAFDPTVAAASGLPARFLEYLLLALLGVTIVTAIQAVGIVLVVALLVTPAGDGLSADRPVSPHDPDERRHRGALGAARHLPSPTTWIWPPAPPSSSSPRPSSF